MRNFIKSLKDCFQLIMLAVTCLVMRLAKDRRKNYEDGKDTNKVGENSAQGKMVKSFRRKWDYESWNEKQSLEYFVKDTDSKKNKPVLQPFENKDARKKKIIYWNEPRIQNRLSKAAYFNTCESLRINKTK